MEFEWHPAKAVGNQSKHGITFHEAATVFGDPLAITFSDPNHAVNEDRFVTFGHSHVNRLLVVAHTDRAAVTRIISARTATPSERRIYEEG